MPKFDKTEPVSADTKPTALHVPTTLPKVTITYCTQCRWLLRAAYFAQELLSTFDTALGEVALRPTMGGVFTVVLDYAPAPASASAASLASAEEGRAETEPEVQRVLLWDRKAEGGFPETKVLKQRVRDCVQPGRGLGHSDGHSKEELPVQGAGAGVGADGEDGLAEVKRAAGAQGVGLGKDDCETCP